MSVYQLLADHLASRKGDRWNASFEDIEAVLERPLPPSARRHQAWWANQSGAGRSQTRSWRSVGWRTARLDLERQQVTFEREVAALPSSAMPDAAPDAAELSLADRAARLTGIDDRGALIEEALRALIAREAASHLAALGGSMPTLSAPQRERP